MMGLSVAFWLLYFQGEGDLFPHYFRLAIYLLGIFFFEEWLFNSCLCVFFFF